ncbi:hypothetical protein H1C71_027137, partial [Ictidomys tridecemlineatus]
LRERHQGDKGRWKKPPGAVGRAEGCLVPVPQRVWVLNTLPAEEERKTEKSQDDLGKGTVADLPPPTPAGQSDALVTQVSLWETPRRGAVLGEHTFTALLLTST